MEPNQDRLDRLASDRRDAFSDAGLSVPFAPMALRDATLLVPRLRDGARCVTLHNRDVHVIGRAYDRDEMFARCGGRWHTVRTAPGAVTVVPVDFEITYDVPATNDYSLVMLPDTRLQACAYEVGNGKRIELANRLAVEDSTTSRILALINRELTRRAEPSTMFVERAIDLLCVQLIRDHGVVKQAPRSGLTRWQVKRVTTYMRERLDQDVSLAELAGLVGLSRFHFCTAFRIATGRAPHDWFLALRIERAKELLANSTLRITDVALAVGYSTPSAFSAAFRRRDGLTPSEYRAQMGPRRPRRATQ